MRRVIVLCVICVVIATLALAFAAGRKDVPSTGKMSGEIHAPKAGEKSLVRQLKDARINTFNTWSVGDGDLFYTVQAFDQDPKYEEPGVKLSIFGEAGQVVYEDHFSEVQNIYSSYALRKAAPQLIVEVNYGGSTGFLKMLDYQDGKVVDLMESVKPNNSFTVSAAVCPQFRAGVNPAKEPFQVLLTEGVGLASPIEKYTKVFRYKDGAYHYVGKFPTGQVDDYMDRVLTASRSNDERSLKLRKE